MVTLAHGGAGLDLHWDDPRQLPPGGAFRLRVTVAAMHRDTLVLGVWTPGGRRLGGFDIRFPYSGQIFEAVLETPAEWEGELRLVLEEGSGPLALHGPDPARPGHAVFQPHLLGAVDPDPLVEMKRRLAGPGSLTAFNWMSACVLDGILGGMFAEDEARRLGRTYLAWFIDWTPSEPPGRCPRYGLEDAAPFAAVARLQPDHPLLDDLLAFYARHTEPGGGATEKERTVAETCYTVAYPLACLARLRGDGELAGLALAQLRFCAERLRYDGGLWLRWLHREKRHTFRNWSRGVAWFVMGTAATLSQLRTMGITDSSLDAILRESLEGVLARQRPSGLWGGFLDDPEAADETSGSAGIAVALAFALREGVLDSGHGESLRRAREGLRAALTPDGLMRHCSQRNTAGEEFQLHYRTIAFYPCGLFAWSLGIPSE